MPTINKKPVLLIKKPSNRQNRMKLYNNIQWRNLRQIYRQSHPLCEDCLEHDIVTPAQDIHHILSPFEPNISEMESFKRLLDWDNLRALCKTCHQRRHEEIKRKKKLEKDSKNE